MSMVAALFVDGEGVYSDAEGVDVWDVERDARRYAGPFPVVAHPPCQRWGRLAKAVWGRWKKEHLRVGNDGGCFLAALRSVRTYGGVLEHPAGSLAWKAHGLITPSGSHGWVYCGMDEWVCEVWQSAYGHRARKATWLLAKSIEMPPELRWDRLPGTHQVGHPDRRGKAKNKPVLSSKEAAATPIEFRDALIAIARSSGGSYVRNSV